MKVISGIITYNPNTDELKKNVDAIKRQVNQVVIIDNASRNISDITDIFSDDSQISIIRNKKNYGVAMGLNQIMRYALDNGYTWVLTLDQDTFVYHSLISIYEKYVHMHDVAMINCQYIDRNYYDYRFYEQKREFAYVNECITSGCLTNAELVMKCGGFDNRMFIDLVDNDMCATLRENGYKIVSVKHIGYLHSLGDVTKKKIFGYNLKLFHYSPMRIYYLSRNTIYYIRKHHSGYYRLIIIARLMVSSVGLEDNRVRKLLAYIAGLIRGCFLRLE